MDFPNPRTGSQTYFVPKVQAVAWSQWQRGPWEWYGAAKSFGSYSRWGTDNGLVTGQAPSALLLDFNLAFVPTKGMRLSAYGVNAANRSTPMADDGTVNTTLVRYARRELGLQFGLRF
jgi:outer membrane receptor protein involved in Fe transport